MHQDYRNWEPVSMSLTENVPGTVFNAFITDVDETGKRVHWFVGTFHIDPTNQELMNGIKKEEE